MPPPRVSLRSPRVLPPASCSSGAKRALLRAGGGAHHAKTANIMAIVSARILNNMKSMNHGKYSLATTQQLRAFPVRAQEGGRFARLTSTWQGEGSHGEAMADGAP